MDGSCHCGAVRWTFEGTPASVTSCNCTVCRRYGALWVYDFENEGIRVSGPTRIYAWAKKVLGYHFCGDCGCVVYWRASTAGEDGRRRIAVNVRLTEPGPIEHLPIEHFDGLVTFDDLPRDGKCVKDVWF